MTTGCYGSIAFEVSSSEVKTFNGLTHSASASYAAHQRVSGTTMLEFTGIGADKVTIKAFISEYLGSDPLTEYNNLLDCMKNAEPDTLVIGNSIFGNAEWVITALSMDAKHFDRRGNVTSCDITISLSEYLED